MKTLFRLLTVAFLIASVTEARAEKVKMNGPQTRNLKQVTAGCTPSSTFAWLNINNARVRVNAGGDMWWDLPGGSGSKYYIPANGSATSLYAGSLWIAGMDVNNQLKCSAIRFRQKGNDFWTGPLTTDGTASIDAQTCMLYDKMYNITRAEVDDFLANFDEEKGTMKEGYVIPSNILNWPAHGEVAGISHYLAPFFDRDGDGEYNPAAGDYPYYDVDNVLCHTQTPTMEEELGGSLNGSILADQVIKGDQTIWWVFNDKGNTHTETGGAAIGMEIRAQAFAFATNDEINNMTFYSYEIINRSTYTLTNTYFSPWTDVDLGYAKDDYVGCDVSRGLGYGYNGAPVDGSGQTEAYGANPPAVGVDFFQGPYMDPDGIDNPKFDENGDQLCDESINGVNFGNGIVDDERFGMRRFVYHNNTNNPINGDPDEAAEYYLLLQGIWKNGAKMEYGGTAVPGAPGTVGPACDFMFPFDSDPCNWGTGGIVPNGGFNQNGFYWSEETGDNGNPNPVEDRRFMQSAGPFTLKAGAVNYITFGVPWARANTGKAWASVELLRKVDDKCQSMFDNCFKVLDGPNAPDLTIRELDRKLVVYLSNSATSNNYGEGYIEKDPNIQGPHPIDSTIDKDPYYRFEGYQVFQLANNRVSVDELNDPTKARLVFQCDVKNNVSTIKNYVYSEELKDNVPTMMVQGGDNGIQHSFILTQDQFTSNNDPTLVNHKTYYFMAIAYAYNNYMEYSTDPNNLNGLFGQKTPYLAGRKNIKLYSAVPHKIVNGTVVNSNYGDQPEITRWVGRGNGGIQTEIIDSQIEELLTKAPANYADSSNIFGMESYPVIYHPTYKKGYGPINVKIVDPLNVKPADYSLEFVDFQKKSLYNVTGDPGTIGDSAQKLAFNWILTDLDTREQYTSSKLTTENNEELFLERGISIDILQSWDFGPIKVGTTGTAQDMTACYATLSPQNGVITSSVTYADSSYRWLSGIRDSDALAQNPLNWIRSGTYKDTGENGDPANNDYLMKSGSYDKGSKPYDPTEDFENIAEGSWAPYLLCNLSGNAGAFNPGPVYPKPVCRQDSIFRKIGSMDIVLTADKSKWTRCPVIEMCMDKNNSEGNAPRFSLRKHASVDKNGNYAAESYEEALAMEASENPEDANYISSYGMGWFPGYVIDMESGARLNLIFGEDSFLADLNGNDMLFNPPAVQELVAQNDPSMQMGDPVLFDQVDGTAVFGGKHYVYIFPMIPTQVVGTQTVNFPFGCPAYDAGRKLVETMKWVESINKENFRIVFWGMPSWVGMPMAVEGKEWLPENNPVKISIRINTPYQPGYGTMPLDILTDHVYDTTVHNGLMPYYAFSTKGCEPTKNVAEKAASDLDLIKVVPNPYYAYSKYENNALVHKVKIANVPDKCVVTIYTVNGTKIRQFKKDDATTTSIDWDLTNHANTPIASGMYIIHIKDNTSGGEKTVKFYCAMRQVDLNTF